MDDFMSGGAKTIPFDNVGDTVTGVVLAQPEARKQTHPDTGEPKLFPNGQPMIMWAIRVATELRDPQDPYDNGERVIYLKWKSQDAVKNAVRASGAQGIEPGGILTLTMSGLGEKKKAAWNAPKEWRAQYVPPQQGNGFMDNNGGQQQQVQQATPQHTEAQMTVLQRMAQQNQQFQRSQPPAAPRQDETPPF